MPDTHLLHCAHDCAIYLVACSHSLIVLDVGHEVPSCTYITAVRRGLAQEHSVSTSLSSSTRPPCAQRTRTICGRAAAKKLVGTPDLDRRAAHRSCTTGEPGTTFFRRTVRRQCPPVRRSHSVRADVATISQLALLASLYVAIICQHQISALPEKTYNCLNLYPGTGHRV